MRLLQLEANQVASTNYTAIPSRSLPVVDPNGYINLTWYSWFSTFASTALASTTQFSTGILSVDSSFNLQSRVLTGSTSITVTNGNGSGNPTFSISSTYTGQDSITTVGTITSGVWNGTPIDVAQGGLGITSLTQGDILYASSTNVLAKLAGNTTTTKKFLTQTGNEALAGAPAWNTLVYTDVYNLPSESLLGRYDAALGYAQSINLGQGLDFDGDTLYTKSYKNAVTDFGAVGDNSTDNTTAVTAAVAWINTTGGVVFWPVGIYKFDSVIPAITTPGGFIGEGSGAGTGPYGDSAATTNYQTRFIDNAGSGNFITLSTGNGSIIKGISFSDAAYKSSGATIFCTGRSAFIELKNLKFFRCRNPIYLEATFKPTIKDCNTLYHYGATGAIVCNGTGTGDGMCEGVTVSNFWAGVGDEAYTAFNTSWATSTAYIENEQVIANNKVWMCTTAGTSAGSGTGPDLDTYSTAAELWDDRITDGSAVWKFVCHTASNAIYINSYAINVTCSHLDLNAGYNLFVVDDTSTAGMTYSIWIDDAYIDHAYSTCIDLRAGRDFHFNNITETFSATASGMNIGAAVTDTVLISNSLFATNDQEGVQLQAGPESAAFSNCHFGSNSRRSSGSYSGFKAFANAKDWVISGCIFGTYPDTGSATQNYGIEIAAGCDRYVITGCAISDYVTGGILNTPGIATTRTIIGNTPNTLDTCVGSAFWANGYSSAVGVNGFYMTGANEIAFATNSTNAFTVTSGQVLQLAHALTVPYGGTGLTSCTQGDILYSSASNTFAKLAKDTNATRYLSNTGSSNNPAWAQVALASGVSGTLPVANGGTGITSLGTGVATFLGTPSSANLAAAVTDETGSGLLVFATSPVLITPNIGTPSAGVLTNCTGLPNSSVASGLFIKQVTSQLFTSTGTYTPTSGTVYCDIEIVGPGGGGGGGDGATGAAAGGGGAGGYSRRIVAKSTVVGAGTTAAITIGTGGAGGTSTNNGTAGSAASTVVANGGSGATIASAGAGGGGAVAHSTNGAVGGSGGTSSSGDTNVTGGVGQAGSTGGDCGAHGGASFYGSGGQGGIPSTGASAAAAYGAGGGGGQGGGSGGAGANGYCRITEYIA